MLTLPVLVLAIHSQKHHGKRKYHLSQQISYFTFKLKGFLSFSKSDHEFTEHQDPNVKRNSLLAVNEIVKNAQFICVSENEHGSTEKEVDIVVAGPDASRIEKLDPDRTSVDVHWEPPSHVNRPITHYTIYYTNNPQQPVKNWKSVDVNEPNRNFVIEDLRPDTDYTFRVRANDNLGPGKLSNAITTKTQEAGKHYSIP